MTISVMTGLIVGADRSELLERAQRVMQRTHAQGDPSTYVVEQRAAGWIVGTVDEVAEQMRALADAGVERFFMQHLDHTDLDAVELLGTEVARAVT